MKNKKIAICVICDYELYKIQLGKVDLKTFTFFYVSDKSNDGYFSHYTMSSTSDLYADNKIEKCIFLKDKYEFQNKFMFDLVVVITKDKLDSLNLEILKHINIEKRTVYGVCTVCPWLGSLDYLDHRCMLFDSLTSNIFQHFTRIKFENTNNIDTALAKHIFYRDLKYENCRLS